jgi:HlyD family secretion protein
MKKQTQRTIGILLTILLAGSVVTAWWLWGRQKPLPEGLIQANGRIEGDHYTVASKVAGRIVKLLAREGDSVKRGQTLLNLDDVQIRARVEQARAAAEASEAQLKAERTDLTTLKKTVPLKIDTAISGVVHAEAVLTATRVKLEQAGREALRYRELLETHAVSKQEKEDRDLALRVAKEDHTVARALLTQAKKQLAEADLGWDRIKTRKSRVSAMESQLKQTRAALTEAQSVREDLTIYAPATGMITTRIVDTGEVIVAGSPLFDIVDLDRLYLKCYVPEKQIGKLRLGLPARIYTDAFPDTPFPAMMRYISSTAEFTPKEVQTPDERVKLIYAVKLYLDANPKHRLTPGLPADAVIRWQEDAPWAKPRW